MRLKVLFALLAIFPLAALGSAQNAQRRRIVRPINDSSGVRLQGTLPPRARAELDRGPVAAAMPLDRMAVVFSRTAAQQTALDQLLAEQQDPVSPNYHKWLTPEEFGDRFGLAQADVDLVSAWLAAHGFTVQEVARSRTWIAFSGIAAQVEAAFHAPLHNYLVNGALHYAPIADIGIPDALSGVVAAVTGLHDFRPHVYSRARRASPRLTSSLSGNHYLAPGDFGTIYNLPDYVNGSFQAGIDGTGQTIGIVGQASNSGTNGISVITINTDATTFRSVSGLPSANLTTTPVGSPPNFLSDEAQEADLDIQWAGAVAPNAAIVFAYSGNALTASLPYLVNQNQASVISISYGDCEANIPSGELSTIESYLSQANAQGQTVTAAAGDTGAAGCDGTPQNPVALATHGLAVDYPGSSVYVTAMGGTEFNGDNPASVNGSTAQATQYWDASSDPNNMGPSAFSYIPEKAWNDTSMLGTNLATGGGVSNLFSKPSWQTGAGVPQDGQRDVPDLALTASPINDPYIICSQASCQTGYRSNSDQTFTVVGGTSAASPTFAGIASLINQKLGSRQGNVNPQIYSLVASSPWAFNDVTGGDNNVPCQVNTTNCLYGLIGYPAGTGYDLATGWGSVDVTALLNALAGTPNPYFVLLPRYGYDVAQSGIGNAIFPVNVVPKQGFSGPVALSCSPSSSLVATTCSFDFGINSVLPPASTHLIVFTSSTQSSQTGTVTVQGTSGTETESMVVNVNFQIPDFQLGTGNPAESVFGGGSSSDVLTVSLLQGYTGAVDFTCTGTAGLSCSLNPVTVALPGMMTALTVSASASANSGSISITGTSGTLTHTLQVPVTVTTTAPDFTLTVASPVVSIPNGTAITDNLTVTPVGGFSSDVALTCSVPGSLGTTSCTINPNAIAGGSGSALVTIQGALLGRDRGAPFRFRHRGLGEYATFAFALGMVFTAAPSRRRVGRRLRNTILGLLLLGVAFGMMSCGGGSSGGGGNHSTTGNLTITTTGGGITHTTTINVTVY
jgi:Pro-kumamolisin, activation domain